MFGMLSCYKLVLERTHRLCLPGSVLHYADCLYVVYMTIQLQLIVIGSYTL
jgi:hypothetical protein